MGDVRKKAMVIITWRGEKYSETKVLILGRPPGSRAYEWQPVTGNGEPGEDFEQVAVRETLEETGLSFTGKPEDLGIESEFEGRFGPVKERAFVWNVASSAKPPAPKLDPKEHNRYLWASAEEALAKISFPTQREAILLAATPPDPLVLLASGDWSQSGEVITHDRTIEMLWQGFGHRILANQTKYYFVRVGNDELPVLVRDAVLFIQRVDFDRALVGLSDGTWEPLDPTTLQFNQENILFAKVRSERTRFQRQAYYQLAKHVVENPLKGGSVEYRLEWAGHFHPIRIAD